MSSSFWTGINTGSYVTRLKVSKMVRSENFSFFGDSSHFHPKWLKYSKTLKFSQISHLTSLNRLKMTKPVYTKLLTSKLGPAVLKMPESDNNDISWGILILISHTTPMGISIECLKKWKILNLSIFQHARLLVQTQQKVSKKLN